MGIGIRHRIAWSDCQAVLRFPDRLELVLDPATSLVVHASDWYRGQEALTLADHLAPAALRIEVDGLPEPSTAPYTLTGLARHSSVVLAVAAAACLIVALLGLVLGASSHRWQAVLIGFLFCIPVTPLMSAIRRRLAVPVRWRRVAQTSGAAVRLDDQLARASEHALHAGRLTAPPLGVAVAFAWWLGTGTLSVIPVLFATGLAGAADFELRRRRRRGK